MTQLVRTCHDWQALTQRLQALDIGWQPQALVPIKVEVAQQHLTAEEALAYMAKACSDQGWCQQPSALLKLPASAEQVQQLPLLAEGAREGHSWKLRHLKGDNWLLVQVDYQQQVSAESATHLAEPVSHLSHHARDAQLGYLRLWTLEGNKPVLEMAILVAFSGGKQ